MDIAQRTLNILTFLDSELPVCQVTYQLASSDTRPELIRQRLTKWFDIIRRASY